MRWPSRHLDTLKKALRRFRRNRRGSAVIEFAFIAPLFFLLLFAIIETAMVFFASQVLETGTQDSARLMYTNQAQSTAMTQAQFKSDLCARLSALFSCGGIYVSVKAYAPGTTIPTSDLADPVASGVFTDPTTYTMPNACDTALVRAYFQWPLYVTKLGYDISNITKSGTKYKLLSATAAFRVEPGNSGCP